MNLKTYHAVCKMTVDGQTKEAFIGMTMPTDERGNDEWIQAHPWPTEDPTLKINPVKKPELENDPSTGSKQESSKPSETKNEDQKEVTPYPEVTDKEVKEVYPTINGVSQARVKKIVQELGIDFATARTLLGEAVTEIEKQKKTRGIASFLENFLREQVKGESDSEPEEINKKSSPEKSWPSVGGLPPEKVEEIVTDMNLTLEECYFLLLDVDKEIAARKFSGERIASRPQMIRDKLKSLQQQGA